MEKVEKKLKIMVLEVQGRVANILQYAPWRTRPPSRPRSSSLRWLAFLLRRAFKILSVSRASSKQTQNFVVTVITRKLGHRKATFKLKL